MEAMVGQGSWSSLIGMINLDVWEECDLFMSRNLRNTGIMNTMNERPAISLLHLI